MGVPVRALTALAAIAAALVGALFVAPSGLAASAPGSGHFDGEHIAGAFREAFVGYWSFGAGDFSPDLESVVDYWFRFHAVKAVIAAILLAVVVALGNLLWKSYLQASGLGAVRRVALATGGVLASILALFSLLVVTANVQGAAAPFSSLFPMLPVGEDKGDLGDSLGQVRQQLAAGSHTSPALDAMINDFSRYHAAMAVISVIVAATLIGTSVLLWRRFARTGLSDRSTRRVLGSFGVLSALLSLAAVVVAVANTTTAANPVPALSTFFGGGLL
ncbi:hypothetical protein ERC79_18995 [Rhodococcus sp. ABRD24]|nr:hypothetical protein ERC79_18995 [Rhodococcus sp. ABRD24]